jgi:hypothetical protein
MARSDSAAREVEEGEEDGEDGDADSPASEVSGAAVVKMPNAASKE